MAIMLEEYQQHNTPLKLHRIAELAEALGVTPNWIYNRTRQNSPDRIPHLKLGRNICFQMDSPEFKAWLASHICKAYDSPESERDRPLREEKQMARTSYQKGSIRKQERSYGTVYELRYRLRRKAGWSEKAEELRNEKGDLCKTQKEALRVAEKRMKVVNQSNNGQGAGKTFGEYAQGLWQDYLERVKPSTCYSYDSLLRQYVLPILSEKLLNAITPADITQVLSYRKKRRHTNKTLSNLYGLLRVMFEVAVEYDLIDNNPVRQKVHRPKVEIKEKVAFTPVQIANIIKGTAEEHQPMITCFALTGIRVGELLALRWCNVDFLNRLLHITHTLWQGKLFEPKSERSKRSINMTDELASFMKTHRHKSRWTESNDFVFCRADGSPHTSQQLNSGVLGPALEAAGIVRVKWQHGFHVFRHSAASIIHSNTGDLKLGQMLLGHSSIQTTGNIYVHSDNAATEATEILAREIVVNCGLLVDQSSEKVQLKLVI